MFRAFLLAALATSAAHAQSIPATVLGTWKISKILPTTNPQCFDATRAKTLLGETLRYAPGKLTWSGTAYPIPQAFARTLSRRKFQDEYKVDLVALGIHAPDVQELDLQHEDADITGATTEIPGDTILLAGPGRIVVSACGVFYSAVKAIH
jgi:hypothetical protein